MERGENANDGISTKNGAIFPSKNSGEDPF